MMWLLENVFGMCEGSAIVRSPLCWIAVLGMVGIIVLFYYGVDLDEGKHRKIHSKPKHTVTNGKIWSVRK